MLALLPVTLTAAAAAAILAVIPDLDVIGMRYGIPYGDMFGHRGFTHSLFFAVVLAWIAICAA